MVATLCLLPLVPRWPYPMIQNRIPAFFTGSDVKKIPQSSTMLYYPFPRFDSAQIMVWQAFAQFRFGLFGGYAVMPDGKGNGSLAPRQSLVQDTLLSFSNPQGGAPVLTGPLVDDLRRELCADGVSTFLLASTAERAQAVAGLFTLLSGRAGVAEDGFILWSGVSTCR
jgi:hypothetical protein